MSETTGWMALRSIISFPYDSLHRQKGTELIKVKIKMDHIGTACAPASKMCV